MCKSTKAVQKLAHQRCTAKRRFFIRLLNFTYVFSLPAVCGEPASVGWALILFDKIQDSHVVGWCEVSWDSKLLCYPLTKLFAL